MSTWTRDGSEKAQSSQTIRILMKTLQYLAEDAANDEAKSRSYISTASAVIKGLFKPSPKLSNNEQVSVLFNSMGWKNAQIKFSSGSEAQIILGSNRHLDQDQNSEKALKLLVNTISKALGFHILAREVDAVVSIDILSGPIYTIDLKAITSTIQTEVDEIRPAVAPAIRKQPIQRRENASAQAAKPVAVATSSRSIDTSQIFLPVLTSKMPIGRLHLLLQDVLAEFSQSWYGENPLSSNESPDERENVITLMQFLTQKAVENDTSSVDAGTRLGAFFAHAIKQTFPNVEPVLAQELIDGASVGSMIRDIKARAFCTLNPGEKCGPNIGDANRAMCDFAMGVWQGCLSELSDNSYVFSGFYAAGKRDPYCLMEFNVE